MEHLSKAAMFSEVATAAYRLKPDIGTFFMAPIRTWHVRFIFYLIQIQKFVF
jgi:hypothetical protein